MVSSHTPNFILRSTNTRQDEAREKSAIENKIHNAHVAVSIPSYVTHASLFSLANCHDAKTFASRVRETYDKFLKASKGQWNRVTGVEVKYPWYLDEWLKFELENKEDFEFLILRAMCFEGNPANLVLQVRFWVL